jgi:Tat protein secretion system quality control protein TatD with DNase activity
MYSGFYNHSNRSIHPNDLENVLNRAFANHIEKLIITGTTLSDSKEVLNVASNGKIFNIQFT